MIEIKCEKEYLKFNFISSEFYLQNYKIYDVAKI